MARKPVHGVNPPMYNGRGGLAMGMSCVYQGRDGVRVKEVGKTTFVEVEMDITQSEDEHRHRSKVALWSTMGKWEDISPSNPTFTPQVGSGIEDIRWGDLESTLSHRTPDRIPSIGYSRPHDPGIYEQSMATPTTGTELVPRPQKVNQTAPRTTIDLTNTSTIKYWGAHSE